MSYAAEKLCRGLEQRARFQMAEGENFLDLVCFMGRIHDKSDVGAVRVDILDDFISGHFPVEKTERRVRKRVHHADKGIAGVGTAAGGDPQAVSFRVFLKGGLKMFRVLDEIPAHVEKEPSGFRRDNSVFSAGKDCEPVLFFRLPEDFAEIGLGHEEVLRGGGDGTAV